MYVYKDKYDEYQKRHDKLWPEMEKTLKEHGAHNYSIFLEPLSGKLFAYVEVENEELWNKISKTKICQKWWDYMDPIMETNPDNSPKSIPLKEVFYLK
jgi:L-rhamnose mutarotase